MNNTFKFVTVKVVVNTEHYISKWGQKRFFFKENELTLGAFSARRNVRYDIQNYSKKASNCHFQVKNVFHFRKMPNKKNGEYITIKLVEDNVDGIFRIFRSFSSYW